MDGRFEGMPVLTGFLEITTRTCTGVEVYVSVIGPANRSQFAELLGISATETYRILPSLTA